MVHNTFIGVLALILSFNAALGSEHRAPTTIYDKSEIPKHCQNAYLQGAATFESAANKNLLGHASKKAEFFDTSLSKLNLNAECAFFFSMGAYDAQGILQQRVVL